jgi:hypothetical protein
MKDSDITPTTCVVHTCPLLRKDIIFRMSKDSNPLGITEGCDLSERRAMHVVLIKTLLGPVLMEHTVIHIQVHVLR